MPRFNTPGTTSVNLSPTPLGTEAELTPGPDDENPFEEAQELRERIEIEQQTRAMQEDRLMNTVPNPNNPDLPPAIQPDVELRFETGELFQF